MHAWNIVECDGREYQVDCTFEDPGGNGINYDYFMRGDEFMSETHILKMVERPYFKELPKCPEDYAPARKLHNVRNTQKVNIEKLP